MFCIRCGSPMNDSEKYCVICGQKNNSPQDTFSQEHDYLPPHSGKVNPYSNTVRPKRKWYRILLISAVLVLMTVIGISTFFILEMQGDGQKDSREIQFTRHSADSDEKEEETELTAPSKTDTEQTYAEQTTAPVEASAPVNPEDEKTIYTNYIRSVLIPKYGLAELTTVTSDFTWNTLCAVPVSALPQENKGIISCFMEDLDNNGSLELLITVAGTKAGTETADNQSQTYQGIQMLLYRIKDYEVTELPVSSVADDLSDEMTYSGNGCCQVSVVNKDDKKYIFLSRYFNWAGEGLWNDDFTYSFLEVTEDGLICCDSISVSDGIISECQLTGEELQYTQVYDAWTDQSREEYFSKIKVYFEKYGADTSWLEPYYSNLVFEVDDWGNSTYSTEYLNLSLPLTQISADTMTITSVMGTADFNAASGTQTFVLSDYANTRDFIGMQSAVGDMNQPLPVSARIQVVPDSEVENEVLHVRELWNTYRTNIEAGSYTVSTTDQGIVSYSDGSNVVMIEVPQSIEWSPYAKIYTYENGKLIFAFFYNESEENRLYIKSGQLFRWAYTLGSNDPIVYDNASDNEDYIEFESTATEQGDRLVQ